VIDDDPIARAVRRFAAALARTNAVEVRSEAQIETERADAALGRGRDALRRGELVRALEEIDAAIAALTHLSEDTALRLDARSLGALAPSGGRPRLAQLFALRARVLEISGLSEQAEHARGLASAIRRSR
jgi:hypothetical protein